MPSDRTDVLSALAEETLVNLAYRVQDLRDRSHEDRPQRGRFTPNYDRLMLGATLSDLMSVTESFVVGRTLERRPALNEDDVSSWHKRQIAWEAQFGLVLAAVPDWVALRGFADVRNAIQHGLGRLTNQQLDRYRDQILNQIRAASVELNGDRVVLTMQSIEDCYEVCVRIVKRLDLASQN